jgi:hypothetical protein
MLDPFEIAGLQFRDVVEIARRMHWRVISANSRSMRLSLEYDVGGNYNVKLLCLTTPADIQVLMPYNEAQS